MTTKHLYDSPDGLVLNALRGAVALNPALRLHAASKSVYLAAHSAEKRVAVISGGGAGHEPAHASYTGTGMLSASVSGDIFASPNAKQILNTIHLAAFSGKPQQARDVLVIINNYTGDRLNFGLAIEKARIALPGVNIESIVVADDISLLRQNAGNNLVGPRGLAGNILVCKLLGALAEKGESLDVLKAFGDALVGNLISLGVGLDHCHVPGRPKESHARLGVNEYEIGLGLHNEPGVTKSELRTAAQVLDQMVTMILTTRDREVDDEIVLFINNLGGMSQLEMGAIVHDVVERFGKEGIHPRRIYCSSYMTSLNAPGFSISVLNVTAIRSFVSLQTQPNIDVYELLDAPTDALAWIGARSCWTQSWKEEMDDSLEIVGEPIPRGGEPKQPSHSTRISASFIRTAIQGACDRVLEVRQDLTEFDTVVGDGDCGDTFAAGANAVVSKLGDGSLGVSSGDLSVIVRDIADILEDAMGGTIGALFAIFLNALSASLKADDPPLGRALHDAKTALGRYTPAKIGDRTIMDALAPFCDAIFEGKPFETAVCEACTGAQRTRGMQAQLGRAAYLSLSSKDIPPDPGAWGVSAILDGMLDGTRNSGK
ncbi:Dak1 domain-containing protein [Flammula alnicola]|nr:Dak1 domain-containing protein [Flammula alnicola]